MKRPQSNVIPAFGKPIGHAGPSTQLIPVLEKALAMAIRGDIVALAITMLHPNNTISEAISFEAGSNAVFLTGATALLHQRVLEHARSMEVKRMKPKSRH